MTKEEFLNSIKGLTGIEVPTDDQEQEIGKLAAVYDGYSKVDELSKQLEEANQKLKDKTDEYNGLHERYKKHFWSGEAFTPKEEKPERKAPPSDASMTTYADLFD